MSILIVIVIVIFFFGMAYVGFKEDEEDKRMGIKRYSTNGIFTMPDSLLKYWAILMGLLLLYALLSGQIG